MEIEGGEGMNEHETYELYQAQNQIALVHSFLDSMSIPRGLSDGSKYTVRGRLDWLQNTFPNEYAALCDTI